jgi:hypothetical protein
MSVNLIAEQTAANGWAKLPPLPANASSSATFSLASKLAAASAKNGTTRPMVAGAANRGLAPCRGLRSRRVQRTAVREHVAVVEQEREMRGAAAFRPPFSHNLRGARADHGELEVEDFRPVRDVRGVDHFEDHRERDGSNPEQD